MELLGPLLSPISKNKKTDTPKKIPYISKHGTC